MKRLPVDAIESAYRAVGESSLPTPHRETVAMLIAQAIVAERARAKAHSSAAVDAIRHAADGNAERVMESCIEIASRAERAIRTGRPA